MVSRKETNHLIKSIEESIPYAENGMIEVSVEAAKEIVDLLKENEPVEPFPLGDGGWKCGNCEDGTVGEDELTAAGLTPVMFNFCPMCGRAVKWN